jgi:hypothetical protein
MKVLTKKALLLFTAILLFVSAFNGRYILSDYSYYSESGSKTELLLTSQNADLFPLNRPEVPGFSFLKKLPVVNFRNQNNDLYSCILPTDQVLHEENPGYLVNSAILYSSLSTSDIIYPFHFFL